MSELYIGIMSGTSVDAADAVLVDFSTMPPRLLAHLSQPWPTPIRQRILALANGCTDELEQAGDLDIAIAEHFAELSLKLLANTDFTSEDISAIGSHGQTVRHRPNADHPFTWQLGDPNTLAEKTGIAVACDFRRRDLACGGQGAPLVPAFHQAIFANPQHAVVVLNLGGIANISIIEAGRPTRGFDTGPANILLDAWCQQTTGAHYDKDGLWAASGTIEPVLLKALLAHPYFQRSAPKSTGREEFSLDWLQSVLDQQSANLNPGDIQATLSELTAISVANAITAESQSGQLIICGGGAFNQHLIKRIHQHLPSWRINTSDDFGIDPQWVEACAFAWLARQLISNQAGNIPAVTGAQRECVLGGLYPGKKGLQALLTGR